MFLIRDVLTIDLDLIPSLYSLDRSSSDVEPSSTEGSSEGIQVNQELRILGLVLILYSPLLRDVVQGLGQGCS
jgi:hypothetical protein